MILPLRPYKSANPLLGGQLAVVELKANPFGPVHAGFRFRRSIWWLFLALMLPFPKCASVREESPSTGSTEGIGS